MRFLSLTALLVGASALALGSLLFSRRRKDKAREDNARELETKQSDQDDWSQSEYEYSEYYSDSDTDSYTELYRRWGSRNLAEEPLQLFAISFISDSDSDSDFLSPRYSSGRYLIESDDEDGDDVGPGQKYSDYGQKYRALARRKKELSKKFSKRSQDAFKAGQKAKAKALSDARKKLDAQSKTYNDLAAANIYRQNNPTHEATPTYFTKCDLHYLYVEEAKQYADRHVAKCKAAGLTRASFIVGKGKGNGTGVSVLRPHIMQFLQSQGFSPKVARSNEGLLIVPLKRRT